jgi:hypothetical protein
MNPIKIVVLSCIISVLSVIVLAQFGVFHQAVYDCDSQNFGNFPPAVQEECVHMLENELKDLIEKKMEEDAKKGITQV